VNFEVILPERVWAERRGERAVTEIRFVPTTPLIRAVQGGHENIVMELVEAGWTGLELQAGYNPTNVAILKGMTEIAVFFVKIGGKARKRDLRQASEHMRTKVLEAKLFREKLERDAADRIKFYSGVDGSAEAYDGLDLRTKMLIKDQLAELGYSPPEIRSVLEPINMHHF
jgi:hypothetical protein